MKQFQMTIKIEETQVVVIGPGLYAVHNKRHLPGWLYAAIKSYLEADIRENESLLDTDGENGLAYKDTGGI